MTNYPKISAIVTHGRGLGHKIGFPTANIELPADFSGQFGVYFASVEIDKKNYFALLSIGRRPTIAEGLAPNAECYIIDFDADIYGKKIVVSPLQYIREERRFIGVEQLVRQIKEDERIARQLITKFQTSPN